ncbi:MAG: MBL fold metallo-hydrolase [Cytophagaceae bacterium]|nr:MBL fold metallo-hydrolase [Cytophagaceae bacterium]
MDSKITIHFLGAAGTVTGSKYLVKVSGKQILIDCGMFQGLKELRLLNWDYLPVNVADIDMVLLTHAHLDHTGFLPRLVNMGFKGAILGTEPTLDIAEIILKDSGKIQEEEAERANREGYSKHTPAKPLYNLIDVEQTIPLFSSQPLNEWITIYEGIRIRFRYNGHIVGATFIEMEAAGKRFVFSGDIGREKDILLFPPERPEKADILFIESTYGDRLHPEVEAEKELQEVISEVYQKQGILIIPSFAVERTQSLMYLLWKMQKNKVIPDLPVVMDSPMGRSVLNIFHHSPQWHKLPPEECAEMCEKIKVIKTVPESKIMLKDNSPKIVIAGSGMVTGGRVLGYLEKFIGNPKATILLVGYQAEGTRGRDLVEGKNKIKMFGKYHYVKADIKNIQGLSGHGDQSELIKWMGNLEKAPEKIFIVHGESLPAETFKSKIKEVYGWNAIIPSLYDIVEI